MSAPKPPADFLARSAELRDLLRELAARDVAAEAAIEHDALRVLGAALEAGELSEAVHAHAVGRRWRAIHARGEALGDAVSALVAAGGERAQEARRVAALAQIQGAHARVFGLRVVK